MNTQIKARVPTFSRKWSEEAVRGSVESSVHKSSASPEPDTEMACIIEEPVILPEPELIDDWLGRQETEDPSTIIDAVSDLVSPMSSPLTSVGSPTFPTQAGLRRPTLESLAPPGSSMQPQPRRRRRRESQRPKAPTLGSTERDLMGVGAFAQKPRPIRKMGHKSLATWFHLWQPPS